MLTALFYKFIWVLFRIQCFWIDGRLTYCPLRYYNHYILIYVAVAVFVATQVCLRLQVQNHSSVTRTNRANGVAVFIGCPIRYNIAPSSDHNYHLAMHILFIHKGENLRHVSNENYLGPGDTIRYIWGLKGPIFIFLKRSWSALFFYIHIKCYHFMK